MTICAHLATLAPATFALDGATLSALGRALRDAGHEVHILNGTEVCQASAGFYAGVTTGSLAHAGYQLLAHQLPHVRRVNSGAGWRIEAGKSTPGDAVLATVAAAHVAETKPNRSPQLFI